ncbi:hypothetical protein SAMN05444377_1244 [Flavobacterium fontis]|uniref:Uncharacterized protein n=1 Tax=Flavobacterium fontis TaxID=1124188 RepID=A0A1M5EZ38_9FLAO|nr:DUF5677 domain-containing protein [Flavobacterium fontis]SHF84479.1 hypothetical protein SAMN05444377_1244 [Flavobacterium fontis]
MQSSNEIDKELNGIVAKLNEKATMLARNNKSDYLVFALRGLSSYTSVLFNRLIANQNMPIEHLAFTARNLFECYLLIAYIIDEPIKAKEFISQKAFEELEINEGFLCLTTETTSESSIKTIRDRMNYINEVMKSAELTPTKYWSVSNLAVKTNNKIEYDAFFKLYSKYVHPSSWIVNSHSFEYDNPVFKSIFYSQGHIFTKRIIKLLSKN